jgi:hypothetical protein
VIPTIKTSNSILKFYCEHQTQKAVNYYELSRQRGLVNKETIEIMQQMAQLNNNEELYKDITAEAHLIQ